MQRKKIKEDSDNSDDLTEDDNLAMMSRLVSKTGTK